MGRVAQVVDTARRGGASILFDIDDLIFEESMAAALPFLSESGEVLRRQYERTAARLSRTFETCDAFIGPTPALARAAQRRGKRAFVHPNLLHPDLVRLSGRLKALRGWMHRRPVIAYMSGSLTHNADFAAISPVIARIMSRRSDVLLLIGGFLQVGGELAEHQDRTIRLPFQDWRVQPWSMNLARVNLAPLQAVNEFTDCKSALKFFEAAVAGVPTVATPTEPLRTAIVPGASGFLARSEKEWEEAITECLDVDTSRRVGEAARAAALAEHSFTGHVGRLREFLAGMNGAASMPYDRPLAISVDGPDPRGASGYARRLRSGVARARAVFGILRRAPRPVSLSRPDLCATVQAGPRDLMLDPPLSWMGTGLESAARHGCVVERDGKLIAQVLFGPGWTGASWSPEVGMERRRDAGKDWWLPGAASATRLLSPELRIDTAKFAAMLIDLTVRNDSEDVVGQFEWHQSGRMSFDEADRVSFPVLCDEMPHRYLVDLARTHWVMVQGLIGRLRLRLVGLTGSFHLESIALVTAAGLGDG